MFFNGLQKGDKNEIENQESNFFCNCYKLACYICFASCSSCLCTKNENDENVTVIYGEEEEDVKALEVVFADENLMERTLQSAQNVGLEPKIKVQVASTAAVKAAIKGLLKNKSKVFALVENIGGKSTRTALEKRWDKFA